MSANQLNTSDQEIHRHIHDFYHQRNVLVAGADGFLGINTVRRLVDLGAQVSIISRRCAPRISYDSIYHVFRGDLQDRELVRAAVKNQTIVFDFAGSSGALVSNQEPFRHLEEECNPHLSLFQACAEADEPPVVAFCSSRLVYGKPIYLPVDEEHPLSPLNIYAVHKITLENYLKVFSGVRGLRFCVMRLSNPYGPYQPFETKNYGIINVFIRLAARGSPIVVFGDGRQKRDYIFVDDVVSAFFVTAMTEKCHGQIFNYGGRENISIIDAVQLISRLSGGTPVQYKPWPRDYETIETGDYQTDMQKIDQYTTLPSQAPLREGFLNTLDYYRNSTKDQEVDNGG